MNGSNVCNEQALVGYLYDECEPAERSAVEAHLATCPACERELEAMRSLRVQMGAWEPPEMALGFQIVRASETPRH